MNKYPSLELHTFLVNLANEIVELKQDEAYAVTSKAIANYASREEKAEVVKEAKFESKKAN
jgi:hypothetical protein